MPTAYYAAHEAGCDEDASPKSTYGPLETMHTDVAASNGSSMATVELGQETSDGRGQRVRCTIHARMGHCLWCFGRAGWGRWAWRNASLKSGSVWESSAGMTRDSRWHSACRLRMLSRTSIDARLLCTNREVQFDLNDTEIGMAVAQGGTNDWRVLVFPCGQYREVFLNNMAPEQR